MLFVSPETWPASHYQPQRAKMRKYQQAFVTVLACVSTVLLLVYKHEYDRVRGVLEVLEVFGDPHGRNVSSPDSVSSFCKANDDARRSSPVLPDSPTRSLLDSGGSAWQVVDGDGLHVFSAHLVSHEDAPDEIVVLGAATPVYFRNEVEATVSVIRGRKRVGHEGTDEPVKVKGESESCSEILGIYFYL
jgi:hypothetical protein